MNKRDFIKIAAAIVAGYSTSLANVIKKGITPKGDNWQYYQIVQIDGKETVFINGKEISHRSCDTSECKMINEMFWKHKVTGELKQRILYIHTVKEPIKL